MDIHILNGDALAEKFTLPGKQIIFRECLIDGPAQSDSVEAFWEMRSAFIDESFGVKSQGRYFTHVRDEINRLLSAEREADINLWFEHDLFCQVNMWFLIFFIKEHGISNRLFRVMPSSSGENMWQGFGGLDSVQFQECYSKRVSFSTADIRLGVDLWTSYRNNDLKALKLLSKTNSPSFPFLQQVCDAHIDRFPFDKGRPQRRLKEIVDSGFNDFKQIFNEFSRTEGIYGFGDIQIKKMLANL
jgi:hypothetical protein